MSACAAVMRAFSPVPEIFGITSAARIPMMVTTSSISTSVNALRELILRVFEVFIGFESLDVLSHGKHRQQHADENGADEASNEEQHQRLCKRNGRFQMPVQTHFSHVRETDQF